MFYEIEVPLQPTITLNNTVRRTIDKTRAKFCSIYPEQMTEVERWHETHEGGTRHRPKAIHSFGVQAPLWTSLVAIYDTADRTLRIYPPVRHSLIDDWRYELRLACVDALLTEFRVDRATAARH